jgi:maleylpyruvate isomerase
MRLYDYFRSSAAFRVRIALALKGLEADRTYVHLRRGEQRGAAYLQVNSFGLVPSLELDDGSVLTQSLAIIEYLDEEYPEPAFLPGGPLDRARVRSLALSLAADTHPITNLRVLEELRSVYGADDEGVAAWYRHWVLQTFPALDAALEADPGTGVFCHGDTPTLADICLVPQVFGAARFDLDLEAFPTLKRITAACMDLSAFDNARPERQPEA